MKAFFIKNKLWIISLSLLVIFIVYTLLIKMVDVQPLGPINPITGSVSQIGFASINAFFRDFVGTRIFLYELTDWGSLITIPIGVIFLVIGVMQLIKRKNIFHVDANILALGCLYVLTFLAYILFEIIVINYRPILIDGVLEASYPSSTTTLAVVLLVSLLDQIYVYIKNKNVRFSLFTSVGLMLVFFVVGRTISGVHWLTDIIGGLLLSASLLSIYLTLKEMFIKLSYRPNKSL